MNKTSDIDLLLIGKTGNGKSALGNTILRRYAFASKSSTSSVTKTVSFEVSEYKETIIKVVDCDRVGDTLLENESAKEMVAQAMEEAINVNPQGYHAFLLVVKFGCRLTAEDQDTINFLKDCFGPNFVREFFIVVFTFGDLFESEAEETGQTFDQWCREQDDVFQKMLRECGSRFVLFDNKTKDKQKQESQIDELLRIVSCLQSQGHRYTDAHFDLARAGRERAIVESQKPVVREEITQETSLILQKLDEVRKNFQGDEQIPHLKQLLLRVDGLIKYVREQDKRTGALKEIKESIVSLKKSIEDSIRMQSALAEKKKEMKEKKTEMMAKIEQEKKQQKDQLDALKRKIEKERREMEEEFDRKYREREVEHARERSDLERSAAEERTRMEEREKEMNSMWSEEMQRQKDQFDLNYKKNEEERRKMKEEFDRRFHEMENEQSRARADMERAAAEEINRVKEEEKEIVAKHEQVLKNQFEEEMTTQKAKFEEKLTEIQKKLDMAHQEIKEEKEKSIAREKELLKLKQQLQISQLDKEKSTTGNNFSNCVLQ